MDSIADGVEELGVLSVATEPASEVNKCSIAGVICLSNMQCVWMQMQQLLHYDCSRCA